MTKGIIVFLLVMAVTATTFAAEGKIDVASIDKDLHPGIKNTVVTPVVNEKYEYYEVQGDCEKDLRGQMKKNGCKVNDGKTYDSLTTWHWKLDYGYDRAPQACTADSFKVVLEIVFRYPKWVRTDVASAPLANKWNTYLKNLIAHENGHRDMAVAAATALSRAVAELPPAESCADLDREVQAMSREQMEKLNADEKGYDISTSHGLTQGAVFP